MNPKLTVLMPIKCVDGFLKLALQSLKDQTFEDYVCHILAGELPYDIMHELDEIICRDSRFIVHNLDLGGISFALNYGINLTKTKYLARMDGDDISHPMRFQKQIYYLDNNPECAVVGSRVELIGEDGKKIGQQFKFYENNIDIRNALKYRMPLCHPALIFRTDVLLSCKGYLHGNTAEDYELYIRIARDDKHLFKNLPDLLFSYRRHDHQLTNIRWAHKAFCNISGFLFTEFMLSGDPMYIIGILANHPFIRKSRSFFRKHQGL
jgi:glycosyltransferase involved in cell wall biosynthesis